MHNNKSAKKHQFTLSVPIVLVIAVAAAALVALTATTESAFAYDKNQAKSDVNSCGNGAAPTSVGCQNTDSQIQGDENVVSMASQQTFPGLTCEDCFNTILTEEQIDDLLSILGEANIETIEQYCEFIQSLAPGNRAIVVFFHLGFAGIDQDTIFEVIDCLTSIGLITPE